jgi:hypothetical protein
MKQTVVQMAIAAGLIVAGVALLFRSDREHHLAEAQRALLTLRYDLAASDERTRPTADYWRGNYKAVPADADPLLAANAAYRAAMAPGGTAQAVVTRLDGVIKQYAEVVRNDPGNEQAAYNYEFAVRFRAAIAARGTAVPPADADTGATPHGIIGGPPAGRDQRQFKMMVPLRPDERQEAEEAGRAGRRVRKG